MIFAVVVVAAAAADFRMQITSRTDYECIEMVIAHVRIQLYTIVVLSNLTVIMKHQN